MAAAATAALLATASASAAPEPSAWILTSLISEGSLSGDHADWRDFGLELLYLPLRGTYGGVRIEGRAREHETDTLYGALLSHMPTPALELHAAATFATDPAFSADQAYSTGADWRALAPLSLLLDVSRLRFAAGSIDQWKPGVTGWFSERTSLTYRYVFGRAFGAENFEAHALRLDLRGLGRLGLSFTAAHGSDPDAGLLPSGVTLSTSDILSAFGRWQVRPGGELIFGAEYEDRRNVYSRVTGTLGMSMRF